MTSGSGTELNQTLRDLRALDAIEESPQISQRDLASKLGIAVGLANACLKTMAAKGFIKVSRINSRKLVYMLTPLGFAERARLSQAYIQYTVGFYNRAKQEVGEGISALADRGIKRIALCGVSDLAEIVSIVCEHSGITISRVVDNDPAARNRAMSGVTVEPLDSLSAEDFDAVVITAMYPEDALIESVRALVNERIPVVRAI